MDDYLLGFEITVDEDIPYPGLPEPDRTGGKDIPFSYGRLHTDSGGVESNGLVTGDGRGKQGGEYAAIPGHYSI